MSRHSRLIFFALLVAITSLLLITPKTLAYPTRGNDLAAASQPKVYRTNHAYSNRTQDRQQNWDDEDSSGASGVVIPTISASTVRTGRGYAITYSAANLPVGHVVTLWAYTSNQPITCSAGCDAMRIGGQVIDRSGKAVYTSDITKGTTAQHLFGHGLHNPLDSEIRFVLRDHGPASTDPTVRQQQLTNHYRGCRNLGGTGSYLCQDIQPSIHSR